MSKNPNKPQKQKNSITPFAVCVSVIFILIAWIIGFASLGI